MKEIAMKSTRWVWFIAVLGVLVMAVAAQEQETPSAQDILQQAVDILFPPIFEAQVHLENIRPDEEPTITLLKVWRKGLDKALIEVLSEGVQQGQKILRVGDELLIFFPTICKTLPLDPKRPLFGTMFNVGDLVRVDLVADYEPALLGSEDMDGTPAYRLDLKAQAEDATYDRIVMWVRVEDFLPLKAEFYTLSGKLLNEVRYEAPRELARRLRPSRYVMTSTAEVGAQTTLTFEAMEALEDLPDEMFTEEALLASCQNGG
jgi:outer membrane lipoprotein-sorting protein